ncbi:unnamed protein product, partial [Symbiodinium microadriaticum]
MRALLVRTARLGYRTHSSQAPDPLNSVLSELSRAVSVQGADAVFQGIPASQHPDSAEEARDRLRQLGAAAEKDPARRSEALSEAFQAMQDEHHLVRLAGVHTAARVAELGADTWRRVAELAKDEE